MSELVFGQLKGLPVNNNVVTVPTGHTLYAPGHVIQVQSYNTRIQFGTTSTSFVSSGLTLPITPRFSTSKILVMISTGQFTQTAGSVHSTIFRGTSANDLAVNLAPTTPYFTETGSAYSAATLTYVDSPASTSPVHYTFAIKQGSSGTAYTYWSHTITLMEIAA